MFQTQSLLRWLQRKRYQYEVTFSLYMLTPTEKFIFNSLLFLFVSMVLIAASLYLPEHIAKMMGRAWFYYAGPDHSPFRHSAHTLTETCNDAVAAVKHLVGQGVRMGVRSVVDSDATSTGVMGASATRGQKVIQQLGEL